MYVPELRAVGVGRGMAVFDGDQIVRDVGALPAENALSRSTPRPVERALHPLQAERELIQQALAGLEGCPPSGLLERVVWQGMCALYRLRLRRTDAAWQASAARAQAAAKGYEFEPELVSIPEGPFLLGSERSRDWEALSPEMPAAQVSLPAYRLSRTQVTNAQYAAFVRASGHLAPSHWHDGKPPRGREQYPVVRVSWYDAVAYCDWLAGVSGKPYRLPTEAEWEKGARGTDGRTYPWGDEWDARNSNTKESGKEEAMPVGAYPRGASPYGLLDMAGNVWEWTSSLYVRYPYRADDGREDLSVPEARVLRGGSWLDSADRARCAARRSYIPAYHSRIHGFRLCVSS